MSLLEVTNLKKIYTTRFGGNKVQALKKVNLLQLWEKAVPEKLHF